jgi:HTH-like domain
MTDETMSSAEMSARDVGPGLGRGGRMSRQRKMAAVLRLLRGKDLELVSRSLGVTAATLSGWRAEFLAGGARDKADRCEGHRGRAAQGEARRADARARVAGREDRAAGGRRPFGPAAVEAMSRVCSPSSGRPYGLARVARVWGICRASVYRHRRPAGPAGRPGPIGPMRDSALVVVIRELLGASGFHGEGYRKIWARLRVAGIRTSRRRVLRLMREHGLLAHQRLGAARGPRSHDGTISTERVDMMWGTDLTTVLTGDRAHRRRSGRRLHRRRSLLDRVRRHPRRAARHPVRSVGAAPAGCARALRRLYRRSRSRPSRAARSRLTVRLECLSGGACVPRHRELAGFCAGTGRQWLR